MDDREEKKYSDRVEIKRVGPLERSGKRGYHWVDGWTVFVDGWEQMAWGTKREAAALAKKIVAEHEARRRTPRPS